MKYRTIVADPPWTYGAYPSMPGRPDGPPRRTVLKSVPYRQMEVRQIAELPVGDLAYPDAHLWLWTTNRYLRPSFDVIAAWGFEFKQVVVWRKTGNPSPFGGSIAPNHAEFLLFCGRGSLSVMARLKSNVVDAPKQYAHSRKPEHFIDMVESVSPGPYLELFSRRHRLGWDVWGNESANTVQWESVTAS